MKTKPAGVKENNAEEASQRSLDIQNLNGHSEIHYHIIHRKQAQDARSRPKITSESLTTQTHDHQKIII